MYVNYFTVLSFVVKYLFDIVWNQEFTYLWGNDVANGNSLKTNFHWKKGHHWAENKDNIFSSRIHSIICVDFTGWIPL